MNWYVHVLKQYIAFDGRSGRKEFWWFFVINLGILIFLTAVDNLLGLRAADAGSEEASSVVYTASAFFSPALASPFADCTTPVAAAGGC